MVVLSGRRLMKRMPISLKNIGRIRMHQTSGRCHIREHRMNLFGSFQNNRTFLGQCDVLLRHFCHNKLDIHSLVSWHLEKLLLWRSVTSVGFCRLVWIRLGYLLFGCQKVIQGNFFLFLRFRHCALDSQIACWQPTKRGIMYTIISIA